MILPTKHISIQNSLLGTGAKVLDELSSPMTISALWERVRTSAEVKTFERFTLALTFLYSIGILELSEGLLSKVKK